MIRRILTCTPKGRHEVFEITEPGKILRFTVKAISNAKSDSDVKPSDSETDEVLREWRESARQLAKEAKQAVSEFFSNSGMSIPAQMIIVTGQKP